MWLLAGKSGCQRPESQGIAFCANVAACGGDCHVMSADASGSQRCLTMSLVDRTAHHHCSCFHDADGYAYDLGWEGMRRTAISEVVKEAPALTSTGKRVGESQSMMQVARKGWGSRTCRLRDLDYGWMFFVSSLVFCLCLFLGVGPFLCFFVGKHYFFPELVPCPLGCLRKT